MMVRKKSFEILFLLLILLVITFMIFVVYYMVSNKEAFINNPLLYGIQKMDGDIYCTCMQELDDKVVMFGFNETDLWAISSQEKLT